MSVAAGGNELAVGLTLHQTKRWEFALLFYLWVHLLDIPTPFVVYAVEFSFFFLFLFFIS